MRYDIARGIVGRICDGICEYSCSSASYGGYPRSLWRYSCEVTIPAVIYVSPKWVVIEWNTPEGHKEFLPMYDPHLFEKARNILLKVVEEGDEIIKQGKIVFSISWPPWKRKK